MEVAMPDMTELYEPSGDYAVERWSASGASDAVDCVAEEVPVALVYNGISHAVMLATPQDLDDFALGFSLSEGIVGSRRDIYDIEVLARDNGIEVAIEVSSASDAALRSRRRVLAGRTGCGLCGVESLEQAVCRPAPAVQAPPLSPAALERARAELAQMQKLFSRTGAVHGAAWCRADGEVLCVREDVGRHNALDKLIGALAAAGEAFGDGFAVLTSRASYEMACKAAAVGIGAVAAFSAPTGMAVRVAAAAGMTLIGFLRDGRFTAYAHPERIAG